MLVKIFDIVLFILVIFAIYFDITMKKIPNFITVPVMLWGLLTYSIINGFEGFIFSSKGLIVGLSIFIVPFVFGGLGGGDVKFMTAIGALKGWHFVIYTSLYAGIAGGFIVIIVLIRKRILRATIKRVIAMILKPIISLLCLTFNIELLKQFNNMIIITHLESEKIYIPYGLSIGVGALLTYMI
jgi:prepilin peptidase CpaA